MQRVGVYWPCGSVWGSIGGVSDTEPHCHCCWLPHRCQPPQPLNHSTALRYTALHYAILYCITQHNTSLQRTTLCCTELHITIRHYKALHCNLQHQMYTVAWFTGWTLASKEFGEGEGRRNLGDTVYCSWLESRGNKL